jgi:hypothetical protein
MRKRPPRDDRVGKDLAARGRSKNSAGEVEGSGLLGENGS